MTQHMKYTPGPWTQHDGKLAFVFGPKDQEVAFCAASGDPLHPESRVTRAEADANARLIAAAPALLEALEFTLARCEENGFPNGDLANKARAAIAQARGGQS